MIFPRHILLCLQMFSISRQHELRREATCVDVGRQLRPGVYNAVLQECIDDKPVEFEHKQVWFFNASNSIFFWLPLKNLALLRAVPFNTRSVDSVWMWKTLLLVVMWRLLVVRRARPVSSGRSTIITSSIKSSVLFFNFSEIILR